MQSLAIKKASLKTEKERRLSKVEDNKQPLSQFLAKQGITLNDVTNPISLTEDIIAMRTFGKSNEEIWKDLDGCRYLRGYEPAEHKLINRVGLNQYVYGVSYEQSYETLLSRVAKEVEETKRRRQAEADAATYTLPPTHGDQDRDSPSLNFQQYQTYMKKFL